MSKKIYISRSNHISETDTLDLVNMCKSIFKTSGNNIISWRRNTSYDSSLAIQCDVFILLVENIWDGLHIGKGSYSELQQALNYGKTVIYAYRRVLDGTIQLYESGGSTTNVSQSCMKKYAKVTLGPNITDMVRASYQDFYDRNINSMASKYQNKPKFVNHSKDINVTVNVNVNESPLRRTRLSQVPGWTKIPVKRR